MSRAESILKQSVSEDVLRSAVERKEFLVLQIEPGILACELFGHSTMEGVNMLIQVVQTFQINDPDLAVVLLVDSIDGYDASLREVFKTDDLKNKMAKVTVVVSASAIARMVVSTMSVSAKLLGAGRFFSAASLQEGVALVRKHLDQPG